MRRTIHFAAKVAANGDVSALCFAQPHAIDLRLATWTLQPTFVTCRACKARLRERAMTSARPA